VLDRHGGTVARSRTEGHPAAGTICLA
jgi:hypothetical protein